MGSKLSSSDKDVSVVMLGLDKAGKTTVLYKLKKQPTEGVEQTIGFNEEKVRYKRCQFGIYDVGGEQKIRSLWRHYISEVQVVVFVVDSADQERFPEARSELLSLAAEMGRGQPLLVLANKQDVQGRLTVPDVQEKLELETIRDRPWHIVGTSAVSGEGLDEALAWLHTNYGS
uniref:ADP-ribosylation factor 6-like isoform X2 n=1 Tax=Myxine glutinosa TaxID=7769 RepID=UPI00358DF7A1